MWITSLQSASELNNRVGGVLHSVFCYIVLRVVLDRGCVTTEWSMTVLERKRQFIRKVLCGMDG